MARPKRSKVTGRFIRASSSGGRRRAKSGGGMHRHGKHKMHAKSIRHSRKR